MVEFPTEAFCAEDDQTYSEHNESCAEKEAEARGQIVVYPGDDELQIDIDTEAQYETFEKNLYTLGDCYKVRKKPSKSGHPHYHITLTRIGRPPFSMWERIALQAILGSDLTRETMNALRYMNGVERPVRFFEYPEDK